MHLFACLPLPGALQTTSEIESVLLETVGGMSLYVGQRTTHPGSQDQGAAVE